MSLLTTPSTAAPAAGFDAVRRAAHLFGTDRFGRSWIGRRVAVVGLGRSGIAAARLLHTLGCRVLATDAKETPAVRHAEASLRALGIETIEVGRHTKSLIESAEAVVTSPGVPEATGPLPWAVERGIPILSEIELAWLFCPAPVVAVTGTNGKSTVVTLLAEVLKAAGRHAVACGNLGLPFSSIIESLTPQSVAVVEVSSFQLGWCDTFRPKIAALLNIRANHLDRHRSAQAYAAAKARLFQRQTPEDVAVLNGADDAVRQLADGVLGRHVWFAENRSNPAAWRLEPGTLRALSLGQQAVLQMARVLGVPDPLTWQVMRGFRGLEHRLERVAALRGAWFVNDSKSTTPDAVLYAVRQTPGRLIVMAGGRNKGLDLRPMGAVFHDPRVTGVVLLGECRDQLRALCNGHAEVRVAETLEEAVVAAVALAQPGTTVLFSPGCASFDMFTDFEDRGRRFKAAVTALAG